MANIKKAENEWEIPSLFSELFDADRFFGRNFPVGLKNLPAANVRESEKEFIIELQAPGFKKENLKLEMKDDVLSIRGEFMEEKKEEKECYTRREFTQSSFCRNFQLPASANAEKIQAEYKDGILNITIPKKEEAIQKNKVKEIKLS